MYSKYKENKKESSLYSSIEWSTLSNYKENIKESSLHSKNREEYSQREYRGVLSVHSKYRTDKEEYSLHSKCKENREESSLYSKYGESRKEPFLFILNIFFFVTTHGMSTWFFWYLCTVFAIDEFYR